MCCVATAFDASHAFAFSKPAGVACRHLARDFRCSIHDALAARGFPGCAAYDCYGAGQRATALVPEGGDDRMREDVFRTLRLLHELLFQLTEAAKLCPPAAVAAHVAAEIERLDALARLPPAALARLDLQPSRGVVRRLLRRVGRAIVARR